MIVSIHVTIESTDTLNTYYQTPDERMESNKNKLLKPEIIRKRENREKNVPFLTIGQKNLTTSASLNFNRPDKSSGANLLHEVSNQSII